ncbi:Serine arginine-rich splicing factor 2 [Dionaea muscipula]
MTSADLHKMFAKFGVVVDSFIPGKRSKAGRHFGFVRYDCVVVAEVAIQWTNGLWIQDKELRVKSSDYDRVNTRRPTTKGYAIRRPTGSLQPTISLIRAEIWIGGKSPGKVPIRMGRRGAGKVWVPVRKGKFAKDRDPTINMVMNGIEKKKVVPMGDTVQLDEDTAKSARFDVGKAKVFTHHMSVINQEMTLEAGKKLFNIRIVEEQVVFICNTDFRCGCACHAREDEETNLPLADEDEDDVAGAGNDVFLGSDDIVSRSFIEDTQEERDGDREGDGSSQGLGSVEIRGINVLYNEKVITASPLPITHPQVCGGLGASQDHGLGCDGSLGHQDFGLGLALGFANTEWTGLSRGLGNDNLRSLSLDAGLIDHRGLDSVGLRDLCGDVQISLIGPVDQLSHERGPVFNPEGINLEEVLHPGDCLNQIVTVQTVEKIKGTSADLNDTTVCVDGRQNLFRDGSSGRKEPDGDGVAELCRATEARV